MRNSLLARTLSGCLALRRPRDGIPHRHLVLRALRQLWRGNHLIVAGEASFLVFLDGIPDIALIAEYLLSQEWVKPILAPNEGPRYYALSAEGFRSLQVAENWWSELSLPERLAVRFWG